MLSTGILTKSELHLQILKGLAKRISSKTRKLEEWQVEEVGKLTQKEVKEGQTLQLNLFHSTELYNKGSSFFKQTTNMEI